MEDLLTELTIDILSRLPVKAIFHCKCVCKKWRNLVMESSFVHLHLSRSHTALIAHQKPIFDLYVINDPGVLEWVDIEEDNDDYHYLHHDPLMSIRLNIEPILQNSLIYPKGSVNGLICLWQYNPNHDNTYICNPVTREYMILPRQKYHRKGKDTVIYGFGVSSLTGEYKVVRIFQSDIPSNGYLSLSEAEVYTLGTGQWRSIGHVPYRLYEFYQSNGQFMNGHCHWIVSDKEVDAPEQLCTFDFDKETFQLFPSSPRVEAIAIAKAIHRGGYHDQCLAILKGNLCKIDSYESEYSNDSQYTIWVMKEYGIKESWHKEMVMKQAISPDLDWPFWEEPITPIEGLKDGSILTVCGDKLWAFYPMSEILQDTFLFEYGVSVLAYRPSFLKLRDFELERVHMF